MSTLGQYRATPETLNDGEQRLPRLDSSGAMVLSSSRAASASAPAATAYDARQYGTVEAQVSGLSGGDTIAFTTSNDGTNYVPVNWIDRTLAVGATTPFPISANQIYSFPGGGYLKWAQTGSASTPTVTLRSGS